MSDRIGSSSFHDVYLPVSFYGSGGNITDTEYDYPESALEGSALPFATTDDTDVELFDNVFVAQWGRSCIGPTTSNSSTPCILIGTDELPVNSTYYFIVRHYLDPQTGSGPSKDALPRHRVMVFDPA